MTVINYSESEGEHYVDVIMNGTNYTFVFIKQGDHGAYAKSLLIDGFSLAPSNSREKIEAYGQARRRLCDEVDEIEDVYIPSSATIVFDAE